MGEKEKQTPKRACHSKDYLKSILEKEHGFGLQTHLKVLQFAFGAEVP